MGHFITADGVKIRDNVDPSLFLVVNADGSINVNFATTALTVGTNTVVSVDNTETIVLAANASRKGATIQNHGTSVLQLFFTSGQAFGAGPILLPQYAMWEAAQETGVYRGIVYGIRAAATENAGVVEET